MSFNLMPVLNPKSLPTVCPDLVNPCMERNIPDCFWRCDVFWDLRKSIIIPSIMCSRKKLFYIFWSSLIIRPFKQVKLPRPASHLLTLCCSVYYCQYISCCPVHNDDSSSQHKRFFFFFGGGVFIFFCYVYVTINCKPGFVYTYYNSILVIGYKLWACTTS